MGFFKWVAGKATGAIGSAVTRVGKIFHSDKVENAGRAIKAFGDNLAGDIGKTGSYDSTSGDVRQTEDLSVTLARYSKNIERSPGWACRPEGCSAIALHSAARDFDPQSYCQRHPQRNRTARG